MFVIQRSAHNPLLIPRRNYPWEATATFNWSPVKDDEGLIHYLYRAISLPDVLRGPLKQISTIGHGVGIDGEHIMKRKRFIVPEHDWERFGCEDPRVTKFDDTYYIFYTALSTYPFSAEGIRVGVALTKDFKKIEEKHLVTPFNAKAMAIFPEKIGGKITAILSVDTDKPPAKMAIVQFEKIEDMWNEKFWKQWYETIDRYTIDPRRTHADHVEVGAPPIKTDKGWLLIYSHIQNYFPSEDHFMKVFGIEAMLLDIDHPAHIAGKTKGPIIVPEEHYELFGTVPNIVFPSGFLLEGDRLQIYYGAADTTGCMAQGSLKDLVESLCPLTKGNRYLKRSPDNPIMGPLEDHPWEAKAVFNPAALDLEGTVHILYRAMSHDGTSTMGYATSKDGCSIDERLPDPVYVPREDFEMKKVAGNSGCEDPRLIVVGDIIYMFYTAFDGIGPARVAASSIAVKDFLARKWNWKKPQLITPQGFDDKDTCILSEKVKGKYVLLHRIGTDICADYLDSLDFEKQKVTKCIKVLGPRLGMWDSKKVGITAPPIKTERGWLLLYHAVSTNHHTYRVGVALLDLEDPTVVLKRSTDPIFEPEMDYEKYGQVNNVVFPCGMVVRDDMLYVYYGGADSVVGVATMKLSVILHALK